MFIALFFYIEHYLVEEITYIYKEDCKTGNITVSKKCLAEFE